MTLASTRNETSRFSERIAKEQPSLAIPTALTHQVPGSDTQERLDLIALDLIEIKLDDTGKDVTWQAI